MCNQKPFHQFLAALPKCEHHMHLEGSLSPELLFELSAKNSVPLPKPADDPAFASVEALHARYDAFTSLDDFLHYYYVGFSVLLTADDFESLAYSYLARVSASATNLRHAELFFDPQMHTSRGLELSTVIGGINAGRERARRDFGTTSLLIPCLLRHLAVADGLATFEALRDGGFFAPPPGAPLDPPALAGLGICSSEKHVPPPRDWAPIFRSAAACVPPVRLTAHAGEEGPADAVTASLDDMGVTRIDHGVRATEDDAVLDRLVSEKILLTVCPLSNVRLRVFPVLEDVPIRKLLDKGVHFSINSDDPAYFGGYILENYIAVQEAFGLSVDDWATIGRNSINGSWCEDARKETLLAELEAVVKEWKGRLESAAGGAST